MKIRSAIGTLVLSTCALATGAASAQSAPDARGSIDVRVTDLGGNDGQVFCALFNSDHGYPTHMNDAFRLTQTRPDGGGRALCHFPDVPAGTYAVSAFYDLNGNGRLDRRVSGVPKEPVAASNDAGARHRAPHFRDASFRYDGQPMEMSVRASIW